LKVLVNKGLFLFGIQRKIAVIEEKYNQRVSNYKQLCHQFAVKKAQLKKQLESISAKVIMASNFEEAIKNQSISRQEVYKIGMAIFEQSKQGGNQ
jgi:hypothetical protein